MRRRDLQRGRVRAQSTFTAILGREACYSGQGHQVGRAARPRRDLAPGSTTTRSTRAAPAMPGPDGRYPVPVPGQYDPFA